MLLISKCVLPIWRGRSSPEAIACRPSEAAIQAVNFPRLAIFRPGIIAGNAHTPRWVGWLGRLVPGPWGNIEQRDIGKAFVAEIDKKAAETGVDFYDNQGMRKSIADF